MVAKAHTETVVMIPLDQLQNHPLNAPTFGELQGDADHDEFCKSVKSHGISTPLIVTPKEKGGYRIIAGHRRRQAAARGRMTAVPCIVRMYNSEDEENLAWVQGNYQRSMTREARARLYKKAVEIEEAAARTRQLSGKPADLTEHVPQGLEGRAPTAKDRAAKSVGMSRHTAEKAAEVVDDLDELQAAGDEAGVEDLRATLNKSVGAAHKKTTERKSSASTISAPKQRDVGKLIGIAKKSRGQLARAIDDLHQVSPRDVDHTASLKAMERINTSLVAWETSTRSTRASNTPADIVRDQYGRDVPGQFRHAYSVGQYIVSIARKFDPILRELAEAAAEAGGEVLAGQLAAIRSVINEAKEEVGICGYLTHCPACDGKAEGCKRCDGRGWISRRQKGTLTKAEQETIEKGAA